MFEKYFNLSEQPFGATPDPRFLFESQSHREALASLILAYKANRGFTALIAKPGMGKTTLLHKFLETIRAEARTIFLFNTLPGPDEVVSQILRDCSITPARTVAERYDQLNNLLAEEARAGRRVVLVIDEAQNLSEHTLEGIRLLTNFETTRSKLIQVVLAGQPQLAHKLAKPGLAQLRQRISTFCQIAPLTQLETQQYIDHRLAFAAYRGEMLFTPQAVKRIAQASAGTPRIINTLCFNALCLCRARKLKQVDPSMVEEAIADLEIPEAGNIPLSQPELNPAPPTYIEPEPIARRTGRMRSLLFAASLVLGLCVGLASSLLVPPHVFANIGRSLIPPRPSTSAVHRAGTVLPSVARPIQSEQMHTPEAPPSATQPRPAKTASPDTDAHLIWVTVVEGDRLQDLATKYLGHCDGSVLKQILALNRKVSDPNHIEAGIVLRLPAAGTQQYSNAEKD